MNAKSLLLCAAIICAIAIGAGAWVLSVEKRATNDITTRTAAWDAERAELESALAKAKAGLPDTPTATETKITGLDPATLIQRLSTLNEDNRKKVREALFCFQGLVEIGTPSIPHIKGYFEKGENVTFNNNRSDPNNAQADNNNDRRARMRNAMAERMGSGRDNNNSLLPASTRIGLIQVLSDIGGDEAIALLGQIIPSVTDAAELVALSDIVQAIDPSAFRSVTINTARNLLASITSNSDKRQLYNLLAKLGDTEYASMLAENLFNSEGRLDSSVLDFLVRTLGEGAVPSIYNAFMDPNTSQQDQARLMVTAMNYVGSNAQANEMFNTSYNAITNQGMQNMMLLGLAGIGPNSSQMTTETAAARLTLLNSIEQQYGETAASTAARTQLDYYSNPSAYTEAPQVDFRQIMGGGNNNRGNRGGGQGGGPGGGFGGGFGGGGPGGGGF